MSLKYKIIILFLIIILIPLNLLGMITYHQYSNTLEKQTYNYSNQIIDQINQNINQYIGELHRMTLLPLYDQEVLSILKKHQHEQAYYYPHNSEIEKMNSFISTLIYKRNEIKGIQIITNNSNIFSNLGHSRIQIRSLDVQEEPWFKEVTKGDGESILIAAHSPSYYLRSHEEVFSVAKVLRDLTTMEHLGVIKVDIHLDYLKALMDETHFSDEAIVLILDKNENLIYQQIGSNQEQENDREGLVSAQSRLEGKAAVDREINEILGEIQNSGENAITYEGVRYLPIIKNPASSEIQSIVLIPEKEILEGSRNLRVFTICLIGVCIIVTVLLALMFTRKITSPIFDLRNKMVLAEEGKFNQRVTIQSNDEIGDLSDGFNRMMERINQLVKQVYQTEIREKDAEIKALQSQINPHFIYNTLESINMMAITYGKYDISDMVSSLGKLIRYTVGQKNSLIKMKEELSFVESYLNIQQLRYGDKLEVSIQVPSHLMEVMIPKLTLQPILENAIFHGFADRDEPGKITLGGWEEAGCILFRVKDNGIGMDSVRQKELTKKLGAFEFEEENHTNHSGIALKNIHERIKLLFGSEYGLKVTSELDKGTEIIISLPRNQQLTKEA